jgi:signal recognition particle receptor subunit beta
MVLVSYSGREINAKIVYYGPGLSGKTTNLEYIYSAVPQGHRGKMVSMKTKTERTLFFDFLPIHLGELSGFKTRFLLYTVPGQVFYNATRKLVLKGVDAIVFVADSKRGKMDENIESLENLHANLKEHGLSIDGIPWVIQYNKRDLPDVYSIEELESVLNPGRVPSFEAVATTGVGVFDTFKAVARLLLKRLSNEIGVKVVPASGSPEDTESAAPTLTPTEQPTAALRPATPEPVAAKQEPPASPLVSDSTRKRPPQTVDAVPEQQDTIRAPEEPLPTTSAPEVVPIQKGPESAKPSTEPATQTEPPELQRPEGMGDRLRRWFARPRSEEEPDSPYESEGRSRDYEREALPHPRAVQKEEGRPIPLSVSGLSPEPSEQVQASETVPAALPREVPILVDLQPEDLQTGVVLKLRIAVRSSAEQKETGSEDENQQAA